MSASVITSPRTSVVFGDLVANINENFDRDEGGASRYLAGEHIDERDLTVRRWGMTDDGEFPPTFKRMFKTQDVLFHSRNPDKVVQPAFDGVTGEKLFILRSKDESVLLQDLLPYLLLTDHFANYVRRTRSGSVNKFLNWTPLAKYEFALPPLDEQQRIAEVLQAVEREGAALQELQRSSAIVQSSLANITFLNHKWPTSQLGELLRYASDGPFGSKIKSEHYADTGVRVIRLQNIDVNEWNDEDKAFVSSEYFEQALKRYQVKSGDVVMAGLGDERIPAGRACVVPTVATPALNKADCFCLRPINSISPSFLSIFLNSSVGLRQSAQFSQGTTRMRLNLGNIKRMLIPIPPHEEQEEIVARMMALWNVDREMRKRSLKTNVLKSAFLDSSLGMVQG